MALAAASTQAPPLDEGELCRRLLPAVRAFAERRLRGGAADDFVQETLLLFVTALREGRIEDPSRAAGYALGICRNLIRDRARSDDRRAELLEQARAGEALVATLEPTAAFGRDHVEDCLSQLTSRARRVIRSTFYDEATDAEIAAQLEVSAGNVRVIRHRTLAALRSCLEQPISYERERA